MVNCVSPRRDLFFRILSSTLISFTHRSFIFALCCSEHSIGYDIGKEANDNEIANSQQHNIPDPLFVIHRNDFFDAPNIRPKELTNSTKTRVTKATHPLQPIGQDRERNPDHPLAYTHKNVNKRARTWTDPYHTCKGASCVTLEKQGLPDGGCNWTEAKGQGVDKKGQRLYFFWATKRTWIILRLRFPSSSSSNMYEASKVSMVRQVRNERMTRICHLCSGKQTKHAPTA